MKAIGFNKTASINKQATLIEIETDKPTLKPRDLLVEVRGVSVNPVDVKVLARAEADGTTKIIGYDAAGIVREIGSEASLFKVGDEVFYSGDLTRQGTNAELHAVDERIVGKKPQSLDFAEAAGLPLTSITAWEILFDSFAFKEGDGRHESILILGAAGGVGSILIQLAKKLTSLKVIATASRPETVEWVRKMGADHVINHHEPLLKQIKGIGLEPRYVAALNGTEKQFTSIVELIKPRGHIVLIDDPKDLNINLMKPKALSFSWEFMFTRSMFQTDDIDKQHNLLNRISVMIDDGSLVSTVTHRVGNLGIKTLKEAHTLQESGKVFGKNVLDGF